MTDPKLPGSDSDKFSVWEGSSSSVEQSGHWSSSFIWLSVILFGSGLIFAFTAKIDQTISVRGKLSPSGSITEIQSPSSGVVLSVQVEEGMSVDAGDDLLVVEAKGLSSRLVEVKHRRLLNNIEIASLNYIISTSPNPIKFDSLPPLPSITDPDLRAKLSAARNQSKQSISQLNQISIRLSSRNTSLRLQRQITSDMRPLYENGGLARNTYLNQLNVLQELEAEISALDSERSRLIGVATSRLNVLNQQELTLRTQLSVLNEQIANRTLKAPVSGTIFNLTVSEYSVVNNSDVLLKIVPANNLQANIEIPNSDIGFVQVGQKTSVSVDSFPSGEFGYIQGVLSTIGSDALPPDIDSPQQYFPGSISLKEQTVLSGTRVLNLQSGMSVTANIKLRSRPVITLVTDIFTRQLDGIKRFR